MTISVGDRVPGATLLHQGPEGFEEIDLADRIAGRRVVIFGLPGAYTRTCDAAHLPSFIRTADAFRERGIDEIICISVNDAHVMGHWGRATGATEAGILMLADAASEWTKAAGLAFTAPAVGFYDRCQRCAMIADDGVIEKMTMEERRGVCDLTAGETLLEMV